MRRAYVGVMDAHIVEGAVARMTPALTESTRPYWTGGATGQLLVPRCDACGRWADPGATACGDCGGELYHRAVSGRGTVFTFTVNAQPWNPELPVPYVVALVELDEQEGLRVATNIVGCEPEEVRIGMPVKVLFEHQGDVYVPLFEAA